MTGKNRLEPGKEPPVSAMLIHGCFPLCPCDEYSQKLSFVVSAVWTPRKSSLRYRVISCDVFRGRFPCAITFSSCDADAAEAFLVEGLDGDKGNTMDASELKLTYRNEGTEVH